MQHALGLRASQHVQAWKSSRLAKPMHGPQGLPEEHRTADTSFELLLGWYTCLTKLAPFTRPCQRPMSPTQLLHLSLCSFHLALRLTDLLIEILK